MGYLVPGASVDASPAIEAFRRGLQALGYVEGQNIVVELRFSKGDAGQFPEFAAELVRLKVDCIVTLGLPAIRSAKQATSTIPIVMNVADDPVQMGLIASLARPGGNITGFTNISSELTGKRLELLKEAFPKVNRIGLLWGGESGAAHFREIEAPARALRVKVQPLEMKGPRAIWRMLSEPHARIQMLSSWWRLAGSIVTARGSSISRLKREFRQSIPHHRLFSKAAS